MVESNHNETLRTAQPGAVSFFSSKSALVCVELRGIWIGRKDNGWTEVWPFSFSHPGDNSLTNEVHIMHTYLSERLTQLESSLAQCLGAYIALRHYTLTDAEWLAYWEILERGILDLVDRLTVDPDGNDTTKNSTHQGLLVQCVKRHGQALLDRGQ